MSSDDKQKERQKEHDCLFVTDMMEKLDKVIKREDDVGKFYTEILSRELRKDPTKGAEAIDILFHEMENETFQGNAQARILAGGLPEFVSWPFYNAIGVVYEHVDRKQKNPILRRVLNIFDHMNYAEVNGGRGVGHTTGIRSSELLSDVCIFEPLYWPGLYEGREIIKKNNADYKPVVEQVLDTYGLIQQDNVRSDFLVTYALLRNDFWGHSEKFMELVEPKYLDRVINAMTGIRVANTTKKDEIQEGRSRLFELLPKATHPKIDESIAKRDWVVPGKKLDETSINSVTKSELPT